MLLHDRKISLDTQKTRFFYIKKCKKFVATTRTQKFNF
jgi:hypothetical protein